MSGRELDCKTVVFLANAGDLGGIRSIGLVYVWSACVKRLALFTREDHAALCAFLIEWKND